MMQACPGCGQPIDPAETHPARELYLDRDGSVWHAGCLLLMAVERMNDPANRARVRRNRRRLAWACWALVALGVFLAAAVAPALGWLAAPGVLALVLLVANQPPHS